MRRLRAKLSPHDSARRFQELGVDVFLGDARFSGRDTVEAAGKQLRFKKAVIATGAKAVIPPIEGLAEAGFFTNETIFNLTEQPRRLAVLGGGPLGCELAQAFSRLGCEVTMIEIHSQFLPREDPQVARLLAEVLTREGITIRLGTRLRCVTTGGDGKTLHLESSDKEEVVKVDAILVGTGRAPNIGGLNLESAGVNYSQAGVIVSDRLQTTNSRIFAAGDVCLQYKFTHTADATARIVIQNSLFLGRKKLSALTIPWCTYTDPEVAHVGLSEQGARLRNVPVTTFQIPLDSVDRAVFDGEDQGFARIHVRPGTDRILGATIVARHAGNIISEISLAMVHNIGLGGIAKVIHPYPTQAEVIKKAGDVYSRTRLTPSVERLFTRWLTWRR
jgi:pyruvate/2-oxoglutarate dehydrogenase complex dihydrolipoamide dehydrogenase (E3) component